jgi:hypothetical protein
MKPTITVVRAVGVEFARRIVRPLMAIGIVAAVALLGLGGWLTTQNTWWWLLEIVFISGSLVLLALIIAVNVVLRRVEPALSKTQRRAVVSFVNKLQRVAENIRTPQVIIIYYIIRDAVRPRPGNFIETVSRDSKTLAPDFAKLRRILER